MSEAADDPQYPDLRGRFDCESNMTVGELIAKHRIRADLHITRVMGAWVVVSDGKVIDVDRTDALECCPMQRMFSTAGIAEYIEEKIERFGHFTSAREIWRSTIAVPYGASEMIMAALRGGVLDCAVTACDGAGTVATSVPEVVQGVGARMNGLFHTSPIQSILAALRDRGCIVFDDARLDQARGLRAAAEAGFRRVGVTVNLCRGEPLAALRRIEKDAGLTVTIAGVCSTGVSEARAREAAELADLAWSCASKPMREQGARAILQITHGIPVFVYTARGLDFVAAYADAEGAKILRGLDCGKQYLLSGRPGPCRFSLGGNTVCLAEAGLPVPGESTPRPLR